MTTPSAAARVSGTIKQLKWTDNPDQGERGESATVLFGMCYHVTQDGWSRHRMMEWHDAASLSAAKAAAQAHYNASVIAAIQTDPEPICDTSLRSRIGEVGGQIHNLGCEQQNNEDLSYRLAKLASELWDLAKLASADPEPQPVAWAIRHKSGKLLLVATKLGPKGDWTEAFPLYATPSSAGMVSVEAAARITLAEIERQFGCLGVSSANMAPAAALLRLRALAGKGGRNEE